VDEKHDEWLNDIEAFTNQCWFDNFSRILRHLQLTAPSSPSFLQSNHV
jgi:hypothetical protein